LSRGRLVFGLVLLVPLGLATKAYAGPGEAFVRGSLGGIFYVVFFTWLVLLVRPALRPAVVALFVFAHWLTQVPRVHRIAARCGIPYTVRTHFFDIAPTADLAPVVPLLNDDRCRGVLSFPYARPVLEGAGVRPEKLRDCFPVVDYARFLDRSPNGDGVMNVGACLPKKGMEDFLELAAGDELRERYRRYLDGLLDGAFPAAAFQEAWSGADWEAFREAWVEHVQGL